MTIRPRRGRFVFAVALLLPLMNEIPDADHVI